MRDLIGWFLRLPLVRKLQWSLFLFIIGSIVFMAGYSWLVPPSAAQLESQRLGEEISRKERQEFERLRPSIERMNQLLNAYEKVYLYRPKSPYNDLETRRLIVLHKEMFGYYPGEDDKK